MSKLSAELKKRGPFASIQQEAMLAVLRTSDLLENRLARLLRQHGLTMSQYNVLRILRGEDRPMPCLEVAERMIQVVPAITRVVDRLLTLELISKLQSTEDRRVFLVELKPAAKRLLKRLDQPVLDLHESLFKGINKTDQRTLIRILEKIRSGVRHQ